jgi:three-Cys-motif partner protein
MGPASSNCMNDEGFLFELPPANLKEAEKKFKERNPIWTGCKAKLIERYLFYFVQITYHGTYIDAFAGPQEPDKPEMWSAKLVMESVPRWLKNFFLFEIKPSQVQLIEQMRDSQPSPNKQKKEPKRNIHIYQGDFNQNINKMLDDHPIRNKEATFCLLDQRTFECDWASVRKIAAHKKSGNKIELFYFFPEGWINRSVAGLKRDKGKTLEKWWGDSTWTELLRKQGPIRAQYVCSRFKSEFTYKHVYPFPIYEKKDEGGRIMYYMIHASDHDEAPVLMNRSYGKALDIKENSQQLEFLKGFSTKA